METVSYLVAEASASGVAATIWSSIARLDGLIDSKHGYVSGCESLRVSLLRLHDVVRNLKADEEKKNADVLVSARISASKTYALVDKIASRTKARIRCFTWCACCLKRDYVPAGLEKKRKEADSLVNELSSLLLKGGAEAKHLISDELREPGGGKHGVNTLELQTGHHLDGEIKKGKTLSFNVTDSEQQLAYTVKTWITNPKSWLRVAKRMSASVERNKPADAQEEQQVVYDVRLPEEKPGGGRHPAERTAFISTSSDSVQAQVRSVLPDDTPFCCGRRTKGAGTLLQRGHMELKQRGEGVQLEYARQSYAVEVQMTGLGVRGLAKDGVRVLRVKGKKLERKVEYSCFVEQTGEVLAIYRHRRRPCITACCGPPASGVVQFLGVGNEPQLRDLLFCTFVAIGLTSDL